MSDIQLEIYWLKADGYLKDTPRGMPDKQARVLQCMRICGADAWRPDEKNAAWHAAVADIDAAKEHWESEALANVWEFRQRKEKESGKPLDSGGVMGNTKSRS